MLFVKLEVAFFVEVEKFFSFLVWCRNVKQKRLENRQKYSNKINVFRNKFIAVVVAVFDLYLFMIMFIPQYCHYIKLHYMRWMMVCTTRQIVQGLKMDEKIENSFVCRTNKHLVLVFFFFFFNVTRNGIVQNIERHFRSIYFEFHSISVRFSHSFFSFFLCVFVYVMT